MWIQTLGTTTDGTTRGLRKFKLQIFIVLRIGEIQKEQGRDSKKNREEREDFTGSSKTKKK